MQWTRDLGNLGWCFLVVTICSGCEEPPPAPAEHAEVVLPEIGSQFDPSTAGRVQGQVTWAGDPPVVAPFSGPVAQHPAHLAGTWAFWPNPNLPIIDPATRGVADAVVYLRGIDARRARPWDHEPVRVELRDHRFHLRQGAVDSRFGFVRRGDSVEMVSADDSFHSLHADGAAFFTLPFPDPHRPRARRLAKKGTVELSSAAGYHWMRAYLFVDEHPYYTRTDAQGRFVLDRVPPGRYEVVCWLPNWHKASHNRYPETCLIWRLTFWPPVEVVEPVELGPAEVRELSFTVTLDDFRPQR